MIFGKFISFKLRNNLNRFSPYFIFGVAIFLILRGSNLGIAYVSPFHELHQPVLCH
jgi:hypothetical protein